MNVLVLHATKNTGGKKDATHVFVPEAARFAAHMMAQGHEVMLHGFDNLLPPPRRRAEVEQVMNLGPARDGLGTWDVVAFFGHGTRRGIQTGHNVATLPRLLRALRPRLSGRVVMPLYACSTAGGAGPGGDGGFADRLRDVLSEAGVTGHIDAHTVLGHSTANPYVRRFYLDGQGAGLGGDWVVAPGSPNWRPWVRQLHAERDEPGAGTLRFDFPFMTLPEVDAALEG